MRRNRKFFLGIWTQRTFSNLKEKAGSVTTVCVCVYFRVFGWLVQFLSYIDFTYNIYFFNLQVLVIFLYKNSNFFTKTIA